MRDVCSPLGFLCFLCAMVPLGHAVWLGMAALLRSLKPPRQPVFEPRRGRPRRCVRCGTSFNSADGNCPECHLDPRSSTAAELRDLEAAARMVQGLLESAGLDQETCERVYRCIEARQRLLLNAGRGAVRPVVEASSSALLRIEQWLGEEAVAQEMELDLERKRELLRGYRLLTDDDLQCLSPNALLGLARLVAKVGLASRALQAYRLLVAKYPAAERVPQAAIEAGRLAFDQGQAAQARWFLERGLAQPEAAAANPAAVALLDRLRDGIAFGDPAAATAPAGPVPVVKVVPAALPVAPASAEDEPRQHRSPRESPAAASEVPEPMLTLRSVPIEVPPPPAVVAVAVAPPEPVVPPAPRRSLAEWLAVFMEERNVLWGEVVGGMLIVGCSIALVISLWQTLENVPFFPFLIFAALTGALLGAGFYTLNHWKLESTSRGLLLIGMLLVPLDFLVLAALTHDQSAGMLEMATAGAGLIFFGWLTGARAAF